MAHDVQASCAGTWQADPLVYTLIGLALLSVGAELASGRMGRGEAATAALLLGGSVAPLASGNPARTEPNTGRTEPEPHPEAEPPPEPEPYLQPQA